MPTRQVPRGNNNSNTKARSMGMANFFFGAAHTNSGSNACLLQKEEMVSMGSLDLVCFCN